MHSWPTAEYKLPQIQWPKANKHIASPQFLRVGNLVLVFWGLWPTSSQDAAVHWRTLPLGRLPWEGSAWQLPHEPWPGLGPLIPELPHVVVSNSEREKDSPPLLEHSTGRKQVTERSPHSGADP